ncbi:hypothetical protein [Parasitella parasitica]|uniref:Uncharacterized protein n=1 Tax=Parasitella parasitica TaxID=35722 RepID=A0A0B7MYZ9_9FUNG|nr:hypothetical protein [Parasitella parasitica]
MDKYRKGAKPVKLPAPVFVSWQKIISNYLDQHADQALIPVVLSLQKLIDAKDASYEKQAACIKESVKCMQKNVANAATLQPHEVLQIKFIVEPIASLGYFAACENLSRRTFVPLIEASFKCTSGTDARFKDFYLQYTTASSTNEPSFEDKPLSQKALTIYATLKFPVGQDLIIDSFRHTLRFLVHGLQHTHHKLTAHYQRNNNNGVDVDQPMNDIQFAAKALLALLSRHLQVAPQMFAKVESKTIDHTKDPDVILLGDILQTLLDICLDTTMLVKECNQVAGMAIAAVINLANDVEFARDWVLGWFFTTESNAIVDHIANSLGVFRPREEGLIVGKEGWSNRNAPMVFALRGLVSSLRSEIVLLDCCPPLEDFTLVSYISDSPKKNLHEIIFSSINLFCGRADLDNSCKVIAFDAMATWLQQTKEMMERCAKDDEGTATTLMDAVCGPIQPHNMHTLIQYVWDHWDGPTDSLQYKMRTIFELSISTLATKTAFYKQQQQDEYSQFVRRLLKNLLAMDWHRKVKYSLLNMLVEKVSTDLFLEAEPHLMQKCLTAMESLLLCPQITFFILAFLERRVQDTLPGYAQFKSHNSKIKDSEDAAGTQATRAWIELWVPPMLQCLVSPSELLRKNTGSFLLQPLFKTSPQSFWYMIRILQDLENPLWAPQGQLDPQRRLNAFIAVLRAGRGLDIVDATVYTTSSSSTTTTSKHISIDTLKLAIYHSDPQVRLDALGLLCESRKATAAVTSTEMDMIRLFLSLNMNSTLPDFRQRVCVHLGKMLTRLRGNIYSQYRQYKSLLVYADKKAGTEDGEAKRENALLDAQDILVGIDQAKSFLYWLCDHVVDSLYPGASYQRVATALRMLAMISKLFGVTDLLPPIEGFQDPQPDFPFALPIANNARLCKILVDAFMNPYDFNRVQAFDILCQFPSPLPGIETKHDVQDLLWWGLNKVVSTRADESDSGAMIFRLVFTKYVMELGFDLSPEQNLSASVSSSYSLSDPPTIVFTERLLDLLEKQVRIARDNLLLASQQHPMHGTLLALQYVLKEIDYDSVIVKSHLAQWRKIHARTIGLIHQTCNAVMSVLSDASPEGNVPTDYRQDDEDDENDDDDEQDDDLNESNNGPKHQVILSCCWRAVKEASSLLQVIITRAPASAQVKDNAILSHQDFVQSGSLLHHLLTSIRHRGAFSAVYPAYVALNTRLLTSRDASLAALPAKWLQENLDSLTASNISITRRSAGLPLCILAIVSSEPSAKKELLGRALRYLMQLASTEPPLKDADQRLDLPQVHAYNIMRTIFMDSKLGTHVLPYASQAFSLAISGFSSHSWAIRNCSVMLFSTLLQRTFGTKKTRDEHSTVNTLTSREFFVRFPDLHPYLLKELGVAVDELLQKLQLKDSPTAAAVAASVHPGLYPILTLLSRMQPSSSTGTSAEKDETVLSPFIPLVMPCAASAIYKTREMAARALVPLVQDVVPTIQQLLYMCATETTTQNEIHGRLLQVQFLWRGHACNAAIKSMLQFVRDMPAPILSLLDLLSRKPTFFCNMNSALLLSIVSEFFVETSWMMGNSELIQLADVTFAPVRSAAMEYCMDAIQKETLGIASYLVREKMANNIVNTTLKKPNANVEQLLFLLRDRDYEVRLLVLEKLLEYYNEKNNTQQSLEKISGQAILVQRTFAGEDNLNCYVATAKLLMSLNSQEPYPSSTSTTMPFTLQEYWNQLVVQFSEKRALSVTESVLPLLGALLAQILRQSSHSKWVQQCLVTWSDYIEKYSQKDITLRLREAVVKSLSFTSSQVLMSESVQDAQVKATLAITQLLQDDDVDVRNDTAAIVSDALGLKAAPVHHERALELVHRHLISQFSASGLLLETTLSHWLTAAANGLHCWVNEQQQQHQHQQQSKVLFAKENPNTYKEDLLDLQWASVDLEILYLKHPSIKHLDSLMVARKCRQLSAFSNLLIKMSRNLMQNGPFGITSKASIFMAAYSTIQSLHLDLERLNSMKSASATTTIELAESIQDLSSSLYALQEAWMHPVLWNLLRGDDGLYAKTKRFLKYHCNKMEFNTMFLLAPDSRKF